MRNQAMVRRILIAGLVGVAAVAFDAGVRLRRWAWHATQGAHFRGDINNAFNRGTLANRIGLFNVYDSRAAENGGVDRKVLDYPPLRLTVAMLWVRWANHHYPVATSEAQNRPVRQCSIHGHCATPARRSHFRPKQ